MNRSMRNSIYTQFISLYTLLKILIEENTNLLLSLFFIFLYSSSSSFYAPQFPSFSEVASFEKIVRMSENDVEISFKTVEKKDEEVDNIQISFFFFRIIYLIRIRKSEYHNILRILKSGIYSTTGFNKSGSQTISRISKSRLDCYNRIYNLN